MTVSLIFSKLISTALYLTKMRALVVRIIIFLQVIPIARDLLISKACA